MKITFCGAARTVTGSCYLVESAGVKFLVDCGSFQGDDENVYERGEFPFAPSDIKFVLLTHAHIDHSGRLPLLVKKGFAGQIYSTVATRKLSQIMLLDSAHIQQMEAEWGYKKSKRGSGKNYNALYDTKDVDRTLKLFKSVSYGKEFEPAAGISFRFRDAGHLLGSAHAEVWLREGDETRKVVFSGDIGNTNQPLIKNPTYIDDADFVVTESTYGDELHRTDGENPSTLERSRRLAEIIDDTFARGGNLVIPAFSVGRTQELLYFLHTIWAKKLLPYKVPTFVDSPMGIKATGVFASSVAECYDDEAKALVKKGENILHFPSLCIAESQEDSRRINDFPDSCVIISSSGMCNAGRIKHHLKYNLWRDDSTILFTGYQAHGTLGRAIVDGAQSVRIFGDSIDVRAKVLKAKSLSGHADQSGIIKWLDNFDKTRLRQVFVVHGEEKSAVYFAGFAGEKLGVRAFAPKFSESYDLLSSESIATEFKALGDSEEVRRLKRSSDALDEQLKLLAQVAEAARAAVRNQNPAEKKKVNRLVNKMMYLGLDIEDLVGKWKAAF